MKTILFLVGLLLIPAIPLSFSETITINTNKEQFASGDIVEINGNVENGNTGDFVALEIKNPDDETILIRTIILGDSGNFSLKFKIPESEKTGNYYIVVNFKQDGQTISETKTITQNNSPKIEETKQSGGCLIATATYGTEMAPQVQMLREIRDNSLLPTESGNNFMNVFNEIYYTFSPGIADLERKNPIFKESVKLAITPMISTLSILNHVNVDSEESVLGYGISLIILNLGVYFVAPAILVYKIQKKF